MPSEDIAFHETPRPFTVRSLAAHWGCSEGAVRKMVATGEIASFRIGTLIRIRAEEVARFDPPGQPGAPTIANEEVGPRARAHVVEPSLAPPATVRAGMTASEREEPLRHALPNWPRLMSVKLAAAYLSISPATLRERGPEAVQVGRRVLYDRVALDRWVDRLSGQPLTPAETAAESREVERRFLERLARED